MWGLSAPTRERTHIPCIGSQILNLWTTRQIPRVLKITYKSASSGLSLKSFLAISPLPTLTSELVPTSGPLNMLFSLRFPSQDLHMSQVLTSFRTLLRCHPLSRTLPAVYSTPAAGNSYCPSLLLPPKHLSQLTHYLFYLFTCLLPLEWES